MRKINDRAKFIILVMLLYLVASFFLNYNGFSSLYTNIINPIFWLIVFLFAILMFRNDSVNKKRKFDILQRIIVILMLFFILYFLSGLIIGFEKTPYSRNIIIIIKNISIYGFVIIFQEYVRKGLINRSGKSIKVIIGITAILIMFDLFENLLIFDFKGNQKMFEYVISYLNPTIAMHFLLTYLTYHSDFIPSVVYRFILKTYFFIVPFIPNFGWFLNGSINLFLPFITYIVIDGYITKKDGTTTKKNKKNYKRIIVNIPLLLVLSGLLLLVSGKFKYQLMAIASNSMNPVFYKGDAVLIEKLNKEDANNLDVNDIIVFYNDDSLIVHRIIEKVETISGSYIYRTKGDNNNSADNDLVETHQIVAKYKGFIPKIGYPTIYVQENIFNK